MAHLGEETGQRRSDQWGAHSWGDTKYVHLSTGPFRPAATARLFFFSHFDNNTRGQVLNQKRAFSTGPKRATNLVHGISTKYDYKTSFSGNSEVVFSLVFDFTFFQLRTLSFSAEPALCKHMPLVTVTKKEQLKKKTKKKNFSEIVGLLSLTDQHQGTPGGFDSCYV